VSPVLHLTLAPLAVIQVARHLPGRSGVPQSLLCVHCAPDVQLGHVQKPAIRYKTFEFESIQVHPTLRTPPTRSALDVEHARVSL
jgi:hypothetical protein